MTNSLQMRPTVSFSGSDSLSAVKSFLRGNQHPGFDIFLAHEPRAAFAKTGGGFRKRADEPFDIPQPVPDGQVREDIPQIAKFDLDVVFVPQ